MDGIKHTDLEIEHEKKGDYIFYVDFDGDGSD